MITGYARTPIGRGQRPLGPGDYSTPYGNVSSVSGQEYSGAQSILKDTGLETPSRYQRWAGLPTTGILDTPTLTHMSVRGASSVSPLSGLRGSTGDPGVAMPPAGGFNPSALPGIGNTPNTPGVSFQPDASVVPKSNTVQRWQDAGNPTTPEGGGLKPLSDPRRYFWATGSIDARAPQANPSSNLGAVAPVKFNSSPSGWEPY